MVKCIQWAFAGRTTEARKLAVAYTRIAQTQSLIDFQMDSANQAGGSGVVFIVNGINPLALRPGGTLALAEQSHGVDGDDVG